MKAKSKKEIKNIIYLIEFENGNKRKITVPENWKVTFGPATKGKDHDSSNRGTGVKMPMAIRFYENETKQRAIFLDVIAFRDMSIPIEEEKISVVEKEGYVECDGVRKKTIFQAATKEWVNPDEIIEKKALPMPTDKDLFNLQHVEEDWG